MSCLSPPCAAAPPSPSTVPERRHEGLFAEYYEAWHLLKRRGPCTFCLHASAEPGAEDSGSPDPSQDPAEIAANSGLLWGGLTLDERNLRVMNGDDPDGLGIVSQAVVAGEGGRELIGHSGKVNGGTGVV